MDHSTRLLVHYARYHRDPRNIATHFIGIPLIVFAVAVLLARLRLPVGDLTLGAHLAAYALAALWYLRQGVSTPTLATIACVGALVAAAHPLGDAAFATWLAAGLGGFVVGWAFQFVGHFWEGRKPAFVDDLRGLLVGPMFVVVELWFAIGGGRSLREHIEREAGPVARQTPRRAGGA
ncbi:MAG: DUF962 domain-containing protein [Rhodocyclaceae bacterium]